MLVTAQSFWVPKQGNTKEEYEDAFWVPGDGVAREVASIRYAIADGATESIYSAAWARLLTRHWCEEKIRLRHFLRLLPALANQWHQEVGSTPLPWYVEEKIRSGAFSSLLGLILHDRAPGRDWPARWEAFAIGDSCLFQLREGLLITAFPLSRSEEFNNHPFLLSSASPRSEDIWNHVSILGGTCRSGDVFYLMTDALACWFLRLCEEQGAEASCLLTHILGQEWSEGFMERWRSDLDSEGRPYLKNDDVTLLRLEIGATGGL